MSYAGSFTSQLLRAAIAGRTGYSQGQQTGQAANAAAATAAAENRRKEMLAQAQAAVAERTAGLTDPNDPDVLRGKENIQNEGQIRVHRANRAFDVANPTRDTSGEGPGARDKATLRARAAYKAKLMSPVQQRFGPAKPGMSADEAEALATEAYGPAEGRAADAPSTSTAALMGGSILRGGGAAAQSRSAPVATSTKAPGAKTSSQVPVASAGGKTKAAAPSAATPAASAIPTGTNLKERDMSPADLWDKKVNEGMTPDQATAYVHRLKGTG